ncbi:MAG: pyridoxamine 5'-phosphate oxidase family protein [Spirochaetia bacterium]|nr:pyridoxamine 5'-phosphate oxidase family protein [Spirochaetia bacterium]
MEKCGMKFEIKKKAGTGGGKNAVLKRLTAEKPAMRRGEKEIMSRSEIEDVINLAKVCRIGFVDEDKPYVLPFNFGYSSGCVYLHCAGEGRKLEILKKNSNVCFEVDSDHELVTAPDACGHGFRYKSVIGFGKATIIMRGPGKIKGLKTIMKHMTGKEYKVFRESGLESTHVIKIILKELTGKKSGY